MALSKRAIREKAFVDDDVWTLAVERCRRTFEVFDRVIVSFSGGKDSTVALRAAIQASKDLGRIEPIDVIFYDEEAIPLQTEDYVRRVADDPDVNLTWYCLPVKHRNACSRSSPYWWPWAPEDEHLWVRPLPPEAVTTMPGFPTDPPKARLSIPDNAANLAPLEDGNVGMILGIRTQESLLRYRAIVQNTSARIENYMIPMPTTSSHRGGLSHGNLWKVYPIYDMQTEDVWTAIHRYGFDYNRAYDAMEMAGVSHRAQRISPAYGEEPLEGLWLYHVCFPEVWDRMTERVPGAAAAARYANTELWSYGGKLVDDSIRPQDQITAILNKYPADVAAEVATILDEIITGHFNRTHEPIAMNAPHPDTGVYWAWLIDSARRGNVKNRRAPDRSTNRDPAAIGRLRREYDEDIADMTAKGWLT